MGSSTDPYKYNNVIGVIIGRFQDANLHLGHHHFINTVTRNHKNCMIILGEHVTLNTDRNPMDVATRCWMIKEHYPNITIQYVRDCRDDAEWSKRIDDIIRDEFQDHEINAVIYGSVREHSLSSYKGKHKTCVIQSLGNFSGSSERSKIEPLPKSEDYRKGLIMAAVQRPPIIYPTVDIIVWKELENKKIEILLGQKPNTKNFCIPGGFCAVDDESYEASARRELIEECMSGGSCDFEHAKMEYITSTKIDDWRYRGEKDKIFTTLFATKFIFGIPKAGDDLAKVGFYPLEESKNMVGSEHVKLIECFERWLENKQNKNQETGELLK